MEIDTQTLLEIFRIAGVIGFIVIAIVAILVILIKNFFPLIEGYKDIIADGRQDRTRIANEFIKAIKDNQESNKESLKTIIDKFEGNLLLIKQGNEQQAKNDLEFAKTLETFGKAIYDMGIIQRDIKKMLTDILPSNQAVSEPMKISKKLRTTSPRGN